MYYSQKVQIPAETMQAEEFPIEELQAEFDPTRRTASPSLDPSEVRTIQRTQQPGRTQTIGKPLPPEANGKQERIFDSSFLTNRNPRQQNRSRPEPEDKIYRLHKLNPTLSIPETLQAEQPTLS